jgi:DNA-binding response OmpR family regulator
MLARNQIYDLYIIDDRLPDGSGDNLCREIRRFDHNTPILLLEDAGMDSERADLIDGGATASLEKPFDFLQLEYVVASLMRRAEAASLKATVAELEAIRDSIYDHLTELESRSHSATIRSARAIERVTAHMSKNPDLALRAYSVFHAAGGSRGHFEKLWSAAIECTIHSCDSNRTESVN